MYHTLHIQYSLYIVINYGLTAQLSSIMEVNYTLDTFIGTTTV